MNCRKYFKIKNYSLLMLSFLFFTFIFSQNSLSKEGLLIFSFKINSNQAELSAGNESKTINFIHPIMIKANDNRSMLDVRFFWNEVIEPNFFVKWDVTPHGDYNYSILLTIIDQIGNELKIKNFYTGYPDTKTGKCEIDNTVLYNSMELQFPTMPIFLGNQRPCDTQNDPNTHYLLPLRFIFETFGYTVEWNNETREITAYK